MDDIGGAIAAWASDVVITLGPVGVGVLALLETVFPPIPSELILPLAGFLAADGRMSLPAVIVAATLGSVGGALVLYAFGAQLGRARVERWVDRYGRFLLLRPDDVRTADERFQRHRSAAVFLGRMIPGVRSVISVPAGVDHMPLARFILLTAAGSGIWNGALVLAGAVLGANRDRLEPFGDVVQWAVVGVVVLVVLRFAIRRLRERRPSEPLPDDVA